MKKEAKKEEKRSFTLAQSISEKRERISFKDYIKDKKEVSLVIDWIFLPLKFRTYGLLLSDGNESYRISYNAQAEVFEKILGALGMTVGKDYRGKILLLKKQNGSVLIEEGEEEVIYEWVSGKGWRLNLKDDIPF